METKAKSIVVHPGDHKDGPVYVKIVLKGDSLSLTGVIGPMRNGDARGGCGQIGDCLAGTKPNTNQGWDAHKVARLAELWASWHLNDMRPACEHQRELGWGKDEVEVVTYALTTEGFRVREAALKEAQRAALAGEVAKLTPAGQILIGEDWHKDLHEAPDADSPLSGLYEVKKRETKRTGWVNQNEHPRGVLSKPCPICGYKYGTSWLKEMVPQDVIDWLFALPATDIEPAWV